MYRAWVCAREARRVRRVMTLICGCEPKDFFFLRDVCVCVCVCEVGGAVNLWMGIRYFSCAGHFDLGECASFDCHFVRLVYIVVLMSFSYGIKIL